MHGHTLASHCSNIALVRHIGISFHDTADMLERTLTEHPEIEIVQLQINYLDWKDQNIQYYCGNTAG